MEFFNKLGQKASEAYKVTADKTGKVAKEAKLRMKMGDLKSKIKDIYKEIGECVYQKHIREEEYDISNEIEEKCTHIDVMSDEIESYLKQCLELKDRKQCPKCFVEIDKDFNYCPNCGQEQEIQNVKEVEVIEKDEVKNTSKDEKSNLEKTVEVESDVDENHSETVEHLEIEEE
ncbi:MAG: hypothetical protein HFJ59_05345 [Clostridia bacterium]|nr:hypothetical protein [Clostridia bacterium]